MTKAYFCGDTSLPLLACTIGDLLRKAAAEVPEKIALIDGHPDKSKRRRWTYQELLAETELLARSLSSSFSKGDHIAIYAANSPEWIILHYAIGLAGLVSVPINPAYGKNELMQILQTAQAAGVFYDPVYRGRDLQDQLGDVIGQLPSVKKTVSMNDLPRFVRESTKVVDLPSVDYRDTVLIQFTSGTTGVPKGAQLHHHGVVNVGRSIADRAGFGGSGVWINPLPMYHIAGSCVSLLGTLNAMGTYVVLDSFQPELMMELIESEKGTGTLLVPTMIHSLLALPNFKDYDTSSLAFILTGAADVPPSLIQQTKSAFNCDIGIQYGQTEANGALCQTLPNDSLVDLTTFVGSPLPHAEICIVDQHSNDILPIDTAGEIAFRGYQAMHGYYNREDHQDISFADGWIRTGDIGQMDERGYVKVTGRSKDVIIRGGMNIFPAEIENLLVKYPGIQQAAIVGLPDEKWGEIVAAILLPDSEKKPPEPRELFQFCRDNLAAHKAPIKWFFVSEYPLTPSGKIQKYKLVELIADGCLVPEIWDLS